MATTLSIDDELSKRFNAAIKKKYPESFGQKKIEVKKALENHIKLLEAQC